MYFKYLFQLKREEDDQVYEKFIVVIEGIIKFVVLDLLFYVNMDSNMDNF